MPVKIAPSLLAADFARLDDEISRVGGNIDWLHLDVMDGHFVPNISFGIPVIAAIRPLTDVYFDCHVMATNPDAYVSELTEAGVDQLTMHIEAIPDPSRAMARASDSEVDFGLVLNPSTPFEAVAPFVEQCKTIVIMSVEPGHGGQTFISDVLTKIDTAREWVENHGFATDIEVDGGITPENAGLAISAGATVLVAGTSVFGARDPLTAIEALRRAADTDE